MRRRDFLAAAAATGLTGSHAGAACAQSAAGEATVAQLHARQAAGDTSARALVATYLARIEAIDRNGPRINAVIEVNPDALAIAAERDRERRAGRMRGPLHGIPVLLKDNIATADRMQTTAGSLALIGAKAPRDAHLVARLREAGAIVLGKTNLSEWANARSPRSTSGWSARGGLTRNPHALDRSASGSSSGSGAAIAAGLAPLAISTETDGSIISPSSICGIVGFKPTVGRVSRDGIVPISRSQDTAGPMTRHVADAVAVMAAISAADERDAITRGAPPFDASAVLDANGLAGARVGVVRNPVGRHPGLRALFEAQLHRFRRAGAELVDVEIPHVGRLPELELEVLLTELKAGINAYLKEFGQGAPVATLADVIAFNERERARQMPYFGQEFFEQAQAKGGLDSEPYLRALADSRRLSRSEGLDALFGAQRLDVLIAPSTGPSWPIDLVNGDNFTGDLTTPAAVAGYPHLTVPMGFISGLPVGLSFMGPQWADAAVLKYGYAYEQATRSRRAPKFAGTARA
jgi:amidase